MARRLGDDELLLDACQIGFVSLWRPDTAAARLRPGRARRWSSPHATGNERGYVAAATLRAVALGELGRVAEMWAIARRGPRRRPSGCGCPTACWCSTPWSCPGWRWPAGSTRPRR